MALLRIYVVEDSEVIRENLVETLEELAPMRVVGVAEDGPTATAWLTANDAGCDVVVIDIFLKHGSGLDVLRAAKNLGTSMTLIVLSNYATTDMRRKCLQLGADRVFDKSKEIEEFVMYCADLAGGRTGPHGLDR